MAPPASDAFSSSVLRRKLDSLDAEDESPFSAVSSRCSLYLNEGITLRREVSKQLIDVISCVTIENGLSQVILHVNINISHNSLTCLERQVDARFSMGKR